MSLTNTVFLIAFFLMTTGLPVAHSGNKKMIEKQVRELDILSGEVLKEIPDLPADGKIRVKAKITYPKGNKRIDILESEIFHTKPDRPVGIRSGSFTDLDETFPSLANEPFQTKDEIINFKSYHK